jgi:16S rRNA (cytosine967-C5)-methyltransferase
LVFDALRNRSSIGWKMDDEGLRALVLGTAHFEGGMSLEELKVAAEETHGPGTLTERELKHLEKPAALDTAPPWVQADVPEWVWPAFENNFGDEAVTEGQAMTARPPLDLRVNTLKGNRDKALETLKEFGVEVGATSPFALRIAAPVGAKRLPNIQSEVAYLSGEVEIQDEGSQVLSLLVDAKPGEQVLDYCAGGGGKTLALSAQMENQGTMTWISGGWRRWSPVRRGPGRAMLKCICRPPICGGWKVRWTGL